MTGNEVMQATVHAVKIWQSRLFLEDHCVDISIVKTASSCDFNCCFIMILQSILVYDHGRQYQWPVPFTSSTI